MLKSCCSNRIKQEDETAIMANRSLEDEISDFETSQEVGRSFEGSILVQGYLKGLT